MLDQYYADKFLVRLVHTKAVPRKKVVKPKSRLRPEVRKRHAQRLADQANDVGYEVPKDAVALALGRDEAASLGTRLRTLEENRRRHKQNQKMEEGDILLDYTPKGRAKPYAGLSLHRKIASRVDDISAYDEY